MANADSKKLELDMLTVGEVAQVLRVSSACVYALVAQGKIACHRIGHRGRSIRIQREDLEAYLSTCRSEEAEEAPLPPRRKLKHLKL
jgi:excisionase family DNA binding protein